MMASYTAADLDALLNLAGSVENENLERIINLSCGCINLYSSEDRLPLMSGTAGSKTISLESNEWAAVCIAARAIYYSFYKSIESSTIGGLSVSTPDLMSNVTVLEAVKEAARRLTDLEVSYG
jgi:hypothetical protein